MNVFTPLRRSDVTTTTVFLGLTAFVIQCVSQFLYPNILGVDTYVRLINHNYLFVRHWLPGPQLFIQFSYWFTNQEFVLLAFFALISALTIAIFYLLLRTLLDDNIAALLGTLALLLSVEFLQLSRLPYGECILLLLVSLSLILVEKKHPYWASGAYLLACLTRQEAWFLLPIFLWINMKVTGRALTLKNLYFVLAVAGGVLVSHTDISHGVFDPYRQLVSVQNLFEHTETYLSLTPLYLLGEFIHQNAPLLFAAIPGMFVFAKMNKGKLAYVYIAPLLLLIALGNGLTFSLYLSRTYFISTVFLMPFVFYRLYLPTSIKAGLFPFFRAMAAVIFSIILVAHFLVFTFSTGIGSMQADNNKVLPYRNFGQYLNVAIPEGGRVLFSYGEVDLTSTIGLTTRNIMDIYYSKRDIGTTFIPFYAGEIKDSATLLRLFQSTKAEYLLFDIHDSSTDFISVINSSGATLLHHDETIGQYVYVIDKHRVLFGVAAVSI